MTSLDPDLDWRRRLLAGCDEDQVAAITSSAAPLLVVAGAGSGKTRVLTRRIAWRVQEGSAVAGHVLALTFTRKAAAELRSRLAGLGLPAPVTAGTFHAIALGELRRRAAEMGRHPPVILDSKARLLARVLPASSPPPRQSAPRRRGAPPPPTDQRELIGAVAAEIEWAKARLVSPDAYPAAARAATRRSPLSLEAVREAFAAYEAERIRKRVLDFDDLLVVLATEIENDPDFAAAQRWRFAHLFVDELQDANPAQLRLLDSWLGGRPDLFAVGDPRQAIYGWNGADPSGVLRFAERYPGGEVRSLDTNYRSSPQVVALASSALDALSSPSRASRGEPPLGQLAELRSARPEGPVPTLRRYPDAASEAEGVAAGVRMAHRPGRRWSSCAVLARTNAQLVVFEETLRAAGIPVRSAAGPAFLARPRVRAVLAPLAPAGGASEVRALVERCAELASAVETDPDEEEEDIAAPIDDEGRDELAALARLGTEYLDLDPNGTCEGFRAFLRGALRGDPSPGERDAVELTTFHRAKGLEWAAVFVTGLEDGFVPIAHASSAAELAEERRLLYVALSRAEEELHCSWAASRTFGAKTLERSPSPLLDTLESTRRRLEALAAPSSASARERIAATRALLHANRDR